MTDAHRVIERAIELIGQGWTREAYAVDRLGETVDAYSERAVAWCLTGAIYKAMRDVMGVVYRDDKAVAVFNSLLIAIGGALGKGDRARRHFVEGTFVEGTVANWNDDTCAGPDEAIELLKEAYTWLPM